MLCLTLTLELLDLFGEKVRLHPYLHGILLDDLMCI